jgi:chromate transporter
MKKNAANYFKLFRATFLLSAFTFGGGFVIISLMKKRFVDELGWLEEEEMLDIAAIAQSTPGAIAVNASILLGWRLMGPIGALVSIIGTILPPLVLLSLISLVYEAFRDNVIVSAVLKGMMAGVCAVIFDVVMTMGGKIIKKKKILPIFIMVGAFAAYFIIKVNIVYIILFCATLGALASVYDSKTGKEHI